MPNRRHCVATSTMTSGSGAAGSFWIWSCMRSRMARRRKPSCRCILRHHSKWLFCSRRNRHGILRECAGPPREGGDPEVEPQAQRAGEADRHLVEAPAELLGGAAVVAVFDPIEQHDERLAEELHVARRGRDPVENGLDVSEVVVAVPEDLDQALPGVVCQKLHEVVELFLLEIAAAHLPALKKLQDRDLLRSVLPLLGDLLEIGLGSIDLAKKRLLLLGKPLVRALGDASFGELHGVSQLRKLALERLLRALIERDVRVIDEGLLLQNLDVVARVVVEVE